MIVLFEMVVLGIPAAFVCGSIFFARLSASRVRQNRADSMARGTAVAMVGITVVALTAWSTREDTNYDDFGSVMTVLAGIYGGSLLILGLGPFVPWLLGVLGRNAVHLPRVFRPAARHVGGTPARTAAGVATTMVGTAIATALMIIAPAVTAYGRATYYPEARPGALVVEVISAEQAATVRAAVQHELPGVPITENDSATAPGYLTVADWAEPYIGDQALLRYLTGNLSTPYDKGTAVLVSTDEEEATSVRIEYTSSGTDDSPSSETIPVITIRSPDPRFGRIFIPREAAISLGFRPQPERLIIDPSHYRVSATEQERLDRRLSGTAVTYVERGYQAATEWLYVVAVMILIALAGALAATRTAGSKRILLRISGGSAVALRFLAACRAAVSAACGTAIGATAGCFIGLCLAWPLTTSTDWEPPPRPPFETPWTAIAILIAGLPVLSAAVAALASPTWLTRSPRTSSRSLPTSPTSEP